MTNPDDIANQWNFGTGRLGNGPKQPAPEPLCYLTVTITSTYTSADPYNTVEEAIKERIARFKEHKTPHNRDGNTITYTATNGDHITLDYTNGKPQ